MTDAATARRIRKRYIAERGFRALGAGAVLLAAGMLVFLLATMIYNGAGGFTRTEIRLPVDLARAATDAEGETARAANAAFGPGGAARLSDNAWTAVRDAKGAGRTEIWVPAATAIDIAAKGDGDAAAERAYAALKAQGRIERRFNLGFLTGGDATDPTRAGIWGALKGSLLTMLVTIGLAFPIGVLSAVYLEEYAGRNRWTDLIEVSINNLA
ncbi:MAG: DUF3333 domain-containing protein, partial [Sphingomonadaceae bacterium]|nr:DUF3333 domain-containing protein [Sphingomonadaceae bacterium]